MEQPRLEVTAILVTLLFPAMVFLVRVQLMAARRLRFAKWSIAVDGFLLNLPTSVSFKTAVGRAVDS